MFFHHLTATDHHALLLMHSSVSGLETAVGSRDDEQTRSPGRSAPWPRSSRRSTSSRAGAVQIARSGRDMPEATGTSTSWTRTASPSSCTTDRADRMVASQQAARHALPRLRRDPAPTPDVGVRRDRRGRRPGRRPRFRLPASDPTARRPSTWAASSCPARSRSPRSDPSGCSCRTPPSPRSSMSGVLGFDVTERADIGGHESARSSATAPSITAWPSIRSPCATSWA